VSSSGCLFIDFLLILSLASSMLSKSIKIFLQLEVLYQIQVMIIGVEASDGGSRRNYNGFIIDSDGENILFDDQYLGQIGIAISEIKRITSVSGGGR